MEPSSKQIACVMNQMEISPNDTLYVYATMDVVFIIVGYWTLSSCGYHDPNKVKLVQGNLDEWNECGGELGFGELNEEDARLF